MKKGVIFLAAILLAVSCKKSSPTTQNNNSNNSNNNQSIASGCLIATKVYEVNSSTDSLYFLWNTGNAYFLSNPTSFVSVGGVWAGGTKFKYQDFNSVYLDSTYALTINPTAWAVIGAGAIPSFTYTNNDSLPTYTGCSLLPDTIYVSQNLNLQINGVSGATIIKIILEDYTAHQITQIITSVSNNNTINISSSSISGFTPSHYGSLQINIQKNNTQVLEGKTFEFSNLLQISKSVYIK